MADNPLYGIAVICAILAIAPAFILERRRVKRELANTQPYTWGLYQGLGALLFGVVMLVGGIAAGGEGFLGGLALFGLYGITGWFVVKRRRWAWVLLTVATFNPFLWIAHYVYGRNRWSEWVHEAAMRSPGTIDNRESKYERALRRIRRWHGGKVLMLWAASLLLFIGLKTAFDPYSNDTPAIVVLWLVLSSPLFVVTWAWFDSRETHSESFSPPPNEELKPTAPPNGSVE
jgi:hypothetical protein